MNATHLEHCRGRLLALRDRLTVAINRMSETILTDARPPGEHDRYVSEDLEKELVLEHDEEKIRSQVIEALARLDCGAYGVCQACGGPIGRERLDALPYAPNCIRCELKVEAV